MSKTATVCVVGQAPGLAVHRTGIPFNDPSGDRLRRWLGTSRGEFYDAAKVALVPMAFCYPGSSPTGDLPPPSICAATWRARLFELLPAVSLLVLCGRYAIDWHLTQWRQESLVKVIANWRSHLPGVIATPHPSGRNNGWLRKNPWFEQDVVPELQRRVRDELAQSLTTDYASQQRLQIDAGIG